MSASWKTNKRSNRRTAIHDWRSALRLVIGIVCFGSVFAVAVGQDTSVRPGINEDFRDPKLEQWIGRFEVESREVYEKRTAIIDALHVQPGQVVADIGAGTGLFTRLFADQVGKEGRVFAVDISQNFLDHIATKSESLGQRNVVTVKADDHSVQLAPDSIDVAFICDTYHHFEFPQHVLASISKSLRRDGRLVVIDFRRIPGESTEWVLNHVRADQATVEQEIVAAGFRRIAEHGDVLRQNYLLVFAKQ